MFEASEPVGMDGSAKFQDMGLNGVISALLDRRPPNILDERLSGGKYASNGAGYRPVVESTLPNGLSDSRFCLPWQDSITSVNHTSHRLALSLIHI